MRHIKSIILLAIVCFTLIGEAKTIRDFFASEPGDILMALPKRNRLDMLDYYDVGQKVATANNFSDDRDTTAQSRAYSTSKLINVTSNYLALSLTESNKLEFKLLTSAKNDSVIMVVNTVSLPTKDSHVAFYNTNWERLDDKKIFKAPSVADFLKKDIKKKTKNEILKVIPFHAIAYTLSPDDNGNLTAHINLQDIIIKEDWEVVKPYINDSLTFKQKGLKFKLVKE